MIAIFAGMMMSMMLSFLVGLYLYQDGLRCFLEKDDFKCAKDTMCHWVVPTDQEVKAGKCVALNYYALSGDEYVTASTSCAIIETETKCLGNEDDDCIWDIPTKRCKFHECYAPTDVATCTENDKCEWNSEKLQCRKKAPAESA